MKKTCLVIMGFFILLMNPSLGFAKEIGEKLNITPTFSIQETYDSNIFRFKNEDRARTLLGEEKMDDYITRYSPALDLEYPAGNTRLILNGRKDFIRYSHFKDQEYDASTFTGEFDYNLRDGFFVNPRYEYSKKSVPRWANTTQREQDFEKRNYKGAEAGYRAGKWELAATMAQVDLKYDIRDYLEREEDIWGGTLRLRPSSDSQFYLKLVHRDLDFETTADTNNNEVTDIILGAVLIFTERNRFTVEGGRRSKEFPGNNSRDFKGFIGKLAYLRAITEDTSVSLDLVRTTETSYTANTAYYVENSVTPGFIWQITDKIGANFTASQTWRNYKGITGDAPLKWQRMGSAGAGLTYIPDENLQFNLSYQFQKQIASSDNWDFQDHQVIAGATLSWR